MATEYIHHLPDQHFLHYLKKRDAMVARAVTYRLRRKYDFSEKKKKAFFVVCSTSSFPPNPSYVSTLDPVKVTASSWVSTFLTVSTLVRDNNITYPPLVRHLDPIETTECTKTFIQKITLPPVIRSTKLSKIKKAPSTLTTTTSTTTTSTSTTINPPPINSINSPSNLSRVMAVENNPAVHKLFSGKHCSLHICHNKHRCPKAPPWPPSCIICSKQCRLRARICSGCGVALCMDCSYVGACPHPGL